MERPIVTKRSFCRFCTANCGVLVDVRDDTVLDVRGDPEHPLSRGYLCGKGRAMGRAHVVPARLDDAFLGRGGDRRAVPVDEALGDLASRLAGIIEESGPDAVGFYMGTSGFFDNAGARVVQGLVQALGTHSFYTPFTIDSVCVPVVAELMSGYSFLRPGLDVDNAKFVAFVGANPVVSHGHTWAFPDPVRNIRRIQERGDVWVLDPRTTETARLADHHLQPRPGSDHAFFAHAVRELLREGADWDYLDAHASGVDELRGAVERFDLATTARLTGLAPSSISEFVEAVRRAGRIALMSGTGLTMSAAPAVAEWLMRALEVVTGSSDRVGGSFFSPGFFTQRDTTNWGPRVGGPGPGPRSRPELPSWMGMYACAAFADEVEHGFLRALVVVGGNPFVAFPDHDRVVGALEALDVVAVADVVSSDTTRYATHLLPCAGQLERGDLNMGSASAVFGQYTPALVAVGARRRKQWHLFADLAGRLGHDVLPDGLSLESCRDEDLLAAGCAAARVPFVELAAHESGVLTERGTYGWVTERVLPHGRWNVAPRSLVEQLSRLDVHTTTVYIPRRPRHRVNSTLRDLGEVRDDDAVFLHADDAAEIGAADGTVVRVASAHGSVVGPVKIDEGLRRRTVSIHHASDTLNVASLTSGAENVDPITGMVLQSGIPVTLSLVGSDDGSGPSRSTTDVAAP